MVSKDHPSNMCAHIHIHTLTSPEYQNDKEQRITMTEMTGWHMEQKDTL